VVDGGLLVVDGGLLVVNSDLLVVDGGCFCDQERRGVIHAALLIRDKKNGVEPALYLLTNLVFKTGLSRKSFQHFGDPPSLKLWRTKKVKGSRDPDSYRDRKSGSPEVGRGIVIKRIFGG